MEEPRPKAAMAAMAAAHDGAQDEHQQETLSSAPPHQSASEVDQVAEEAVAVPAPVLAAPAPPAPSGKRRKLLNAKAAKAAMQLHD